MSRSRTSSKAILTIVGCTLYYLYIVDFQNAVSTSVEHKSTRVVSTMQTYLHARVCIRSDSLLRTSLCIGLYTESIIYKSLYKLASVQQCQVTLDLADSCQLK